MKQTKFRGLRIDGREWVYGDLVQTNQFTYILSTSFIPVISLPSDYFTEVHEKTVGQFTGRTDNHGNDIYSGDILKSLHFIEGKKKHWLYHRVEWTDRLTGWQTISRGQKGTENHGNPQLWVYLKNADCERIGNIHQNPELLES